MHTFKTGFRAFVSLSLIALCTIFPSNADASGNSQSSRERAMQAGQQLREYRRQAHKLSLKEKVNGVSSAPADVRITINRAEQTASMIFYYDNIESGTNGWTIDPNVGGIGTLDESWLQTTLNSSSPAHSWWPGTESQANYDKGHLNAAVISPTIDLTGAVGPITLLFAENYATELGWDYCMVDVSTDGGANWSNLRGGYGSAPSGDSRGWQITELDLSPYAGQSINVRYYFNTGDEKYNNFPGWFVDDVVIFDQGGRVTGKKFFDVNNNSQKDDGERGVKDWLITASGPVTLTTRTNYRGRYWLTLPLGSYTVSEAFQPNWTQTYPPSGTWTVDLSTPDTLVDSIHFGNYIHASFINGVKFHDVNRDSIQNAGDTALAEWKIILTDTLGNEIDFDRTDSLGEYSLYIYQPGRYVVKEVPKANWVLTYPAGESYIIDVPDLSTISTGNDFGNYYSPLVNSILGVNFNDRDRNGQLDVGESGVEGFTVRLTGSTDLGDAVNRTRRTDSSGYYQFLNLQAGSYRVVEIPREGWWPSLTPPDLRLDAGTTLDSIDFGNFEFLPGSVSGMKYNDLNGNGAKDSGETGLAGWTIQLNGSAYYGKSLNKSEITDGSGYYHFDGIWPGNYNVSEIFRNNWRQTQPANLAPHYLAPGVEESPSGIDFGNTLDSTFSLSFRSFKPESLALGVDKKGKHKPIKAIPDKAEFSFKFYVDTVGVSGIRVVFARSVNPFLPMTVTPYDDSILVKTSADDDKWKQLEFGWKSGLFQPGDSITIRAFTRKPKLQSVIKYRFFPRDANNNTWKTDAVEVSNILRLPMPNSINLIQAAGPGLRVGLGGPHSVVHTNYGLVLKSLVERGDRMHIGVERCLGKFSSGSSIRKQQRYLTPTKHNNRLFAEAISLQMNIIGSDHGLTPGGFGNLVFDDGAANPFNGLSIRDIAGKLDSAMSGFNETTKTCSQSSQTFEEFYTTVRMIDSAFCGPIDTESFALGLRFKAVRALADVPFLRLDPAAASRSIIPFQTVSEQIPEQSALYQNYPNPFNPTTTVSFVISNSSFVTLKVFNVLGQEVAELVHGELMDEGDQEVEFDGANLSSGIYFYRIIAQPVDDDGNMTGEQFAAVRKMMLLK